MLVSRYKAALGKSTDRQSLYDHTLSCVDTALRVARLVGEEPGPRLDQLIFATFIHDVGKLDPNFQALLEAAASSQPLPARRVKHEASTFAYDHLQLVAESKEAIREELRGTCGYSLDLGNLRGEAMDHIWAFAVTHHGLFYLSYERDQNSTLRPLIRRQWTSFYPNEERRITLVDLLFEYHPLGGLVIIADLVASNCHELQKDYQFLFGQVSSLGEIFAKLIESAESIEEGMKRYDPRDYGLKETLKLLEGGSR
ncbi:MAG: CRISPR-associated endonuclease Cas3'' [Anaerolineae bacterium]